MAPVTPAGYKGYQCLNPPIPSWDSDSDSDQNPTQPLFSKSHSFPPGVYPHPAPPGQPWHPTVWTLHSHPDPQPWGVLDQARLLSILFSPQPEQLGLLSPKIPPERK